MHDLHSPTSEFIEGFYTRANRYMSITYSLLSKGFLDHEDAIAKIRFEIYALHHQIHDLVPPLERKLARFERQIDLSHQVSDMSFFVSEGLS